MKHVFRWVIVCVALGGGTAWAQEPPPWSIPAHAVKDPKGAYVVHEPFSKGLGWTGIVTAVAGMTVLGPWGTEYNILGQDYCVTDYAVSADSCLAKGQQAAIGAAMIGSGVFIAWLGFHKVTKKISLSPQVSRTQVGATAKVVW